MHPVLFINRYQFKRNLLVQQWLFYHIVKHTMNKENAMNVMQIIIYMWILRKVCIVYKMVITLDPIY